MASKTVSLQLEGIQSWYNGTARELPVYEPSPPQDNDRESLNRVYWVIAHIEDQLTQNSIGYTKELNAGFSRERIVIDGNLKSTITFELDKTAWQNSTGFFRDQTRKFIPNQGFLSLVSLFEGLDESDFT